VQRWRISCFARSVSYVFEIVSTFAVLDAVDEHTDVSPRAFDGSLLSLSHRRRRFPCERAKMPTFIQSLTFSVVPPVLAPVAKPIASPETFGRADIPMILAFRDEGMCFIASADGDGGRMHACF